MRKNDKFISGKILEFEGSFSGTQSHYPFVFRCIGELERKGREDLFTHDTEDHEGIRKRQKQKEKEDLVTQSGKATDNLASISRQLAETVER